MNEEDISVAMNVMKKLAEKDLSVETISDAFRKAANFDPDEISAKIIDKRGEKIKELQKYKALYETGYTTNKTPEKK